MATTPRALGDVSNAGLQTMEMIVVPPGADDEIGYRGYVQCFKGNRT
jgi:hypothetical protein